MRMCKINPRSLWALDVDNNVYWYVVGETINALTPVLYFPVFIPFFRNEIWEGNIWEAMNEGPVR